MNKDQKIRNGRSIFLLAILIIVGITFTLPANVFADNQTYNTPVVQRLIYRVTFNPNRGKIKTKSKKVQYSNIYGVLPTPTRSKYIFKGWYTKKSGGSKITQYSKYKSKKNSTLYARWQKKTSYDRSVMNYINKYRKKKKLVKLKWDKKLLKGTNKRAKEITRKFSHVRPNGGSGARLLLKYVKKGRSSGECLGKGLPEPSKLVKAFMRSPAHKRILMGKKARTCAVTSRVKGGTTYWCVGTSALYRK